MLVCNIDAYIIYHKYPMSIVFLPVDIDLTDFDFEQFDKSQRLTSVYNPYWESTVISQTTQDKNCFDRVLAQLPFKEITVLTYKTQEHPVNQHVDVYPEMTFKQDELAHIRAHEPAGYRLVVKGSPSVLEVYNGQEWVSAHTPAPCCYLLNSTQGLHRVAADPGRTIIYIRGILDTERHYALIAKSLKKYRTLAISTLAATL
jgi:hypothetical protein